MYVEIGDEQPEAKKFWGKHGFKKVSSSFTKTTTTTDTIWMSDQQMIFCENNCFRFNDTEQYVKILDDELTVLL